MDMYIEQMLRDCEACNRRFAVQYEFSAPRVPSWSSDRVSVRVVRCPSCRHLNALVMLMYAHHVAVKAIPGPDPLDVRVHPHTMRGLRTAPAPTRPLRLTHRARITRHLMVTAIDLMRRWRPFLP